MPYSSQLDDALLMQKHLENIDILTKYEIYLKDVLEHREEMLEKEKRYIDEYLSFIKPRLKKWVLLGTVILTVAFFFLIFAGNNFKIEDGFLNLLKLSLQNIFGVLNNTFTFEEMGIGYILFSAAMLIFPFCCLGTIYCVAFLIALPFRYFYLIYEKRRTAKYYDKKVEATSLTDAKNMIAQIRPTIRKADDEATKLFDKYCMDSRLRNRENVAYIIKLLEINKKKEVTIQQIANYILKNGLIKETFDRKTWAVGLLYYDPDFIWYTKSNPWLIKPMRRKEKQKKILLFPLLLPWYILKWQLKVLGALFGIDSETIKNASHTYTSSSTDSEMKHGTASGIPEASENKKFLFRDSKGYLCESGGVFHDGKGNLCEPGGLFYDARGNLCDSNSLYYDSKGYLCEPGGIFHDAYGNRIDPRN